MTAWMQTDGEPSTMFVIVFIFLLPIWMWLGEELIGSVVRWWKRRR